MTWHRFTEMGIHAAILGPPGGKKVVDLGPM
jgi:hypothetical protein